MGIPVKDIAGALKLELGIVEQLAKYLYPNKVLFTYDEALVLRDYYYEFGGETVGTKVDSNDGWLKLERIKSFIKIRVESAEKKQNILYFPSMADRSSPTLA